MLSVVDALAIVADVMCDQCVSSTLQAALLTHVCQ